MLNKIQIISSLKFMNEKSHKFAKKRLKADGCHMTSDLGIVPLV